MEKTTVREVKERDVGWLAGIIDGEGSICFTRPKPDSKNPAKIIYGIHIVNTNKEMLKRCLEIIDHLSGQNNELKLKPKHYKSTNYKSTPLDCYQITIRKKESLRLVLESIIDLLTEKRLKSLKLLNYLQNHKNGERIPLEKYDEFLSFTPAETK